MALVRFPQRTRRIVGEEGLLGDVSILERLDDVDLDAHEHDGLGKATLTPTAIRSFPEATHTLQGEVRLTLDRRLLPGDSPVAALDQIRRALNGLTPWHVDVAEGPLMFPAELAAHGPLFASIKRAHHAAGLPVPVTFFSHGSLDAGLFTREGIEATMWGPGDMDQWHSDNEYILVPELVSGAHAYHAFLRDYLM